MLLVRLVERKHVAYRLVVDGERIMEAHDSRAYCARRSAVAAMAASLLLMSCGRGGPGLAGQSQTPFSGGSRKPAADISIESGGPVKVAVGKSAVWALGSELLFRIDPSSNRVVARINPTPTSWEFPGSGEAIAVRGDEVWVAMSSTRPAVVPPLPSSSRTVPTSGSRSSDADWALVRIDPNSNAPSASLSFHAG